MLYESFDAVIGVMFDRGAKIYCQTNEEELQVINILEEAGHPLSQGGTAQFFQRNRDTVQKQYPIIGLNDRLGDGTLVLWRNEGFRAALDMTAAEFFTAVNSSVEQEPFIGNLLTLYGMEV